MQDAMAAGPDSPHARRLQGILDTLGIGLSDILGLLGLTQGQLDILKLLTGVLNVVGGVLQVDGGLKVG